MFESQDEPAGALGIQRSCRNTVVGRWTGQTGRADHATQRAFSKRALAAHTAGLSGDSQFAPTRRAKPSLASQSLAAHSLTVSFLTKSDVILTIKFYHLRQVNGTSCIEVQECAP